MGNEKKKYLEISKETKAPRGRARNMDDSHSFYFVLFDNDGDATGLDRGSRSDQVQQANGKRNGWCARVPPGMFRGTAVCGGKQ